jgi:hypothetical protein
VRSPRPAGDALEADGPGGVDHTDADRVDAHGTDANGIPGTDPDAPHSTDPTDPHDPQEVTR